MDAAELDHRARTLSGCIPPLLVSQLLEHGHSEEVGFQAGRGEWFCAREWAQLLARHGRGDEAIDVMRGHADTHHGDDWILHTLADLCLDQGRPDDGLAHLDALAAARGDEEDWDLYWNGCR